DSTGERSAAAVLAILDWIYQNHMTVSPPIQVVNMSIGSDRESAGTGPTTQAIVNLGQIGITVVTGAGNNGTCDTTATFPSTGQSYPAGIGYIAVAPTAITVGAADHQGTVDRSDDVIASFSRVGPGIGQIRKPDLVAYGGGCSNPGCPTGPCAGGANDAITSTESPSGYGSVVGTSIAAPQVAGIVACWLEAQPRMWVHNIKQTLRMHAEDFGPPGWDSAWGDGLIDVGQIQGLGGAVPANPCDLEVTSIDYTPAPVVCNQPVDINVWVHNAGNIPVDTFTLSIYRYYFGPNYAPPHLFPVIDTPLVNMQGALMPDSSRMFQVQWTPGISDSLPLSGHSCFWAFVKANCDPFSQNDKDNVNFSVSGLVNNQCKSAAFAPVASSANGDKNQAAPEEPVMITMRLAHDLPGEQLVNVHLENPDPANWNAELVAADGTAGTSLTLPGDMAGCAVWVDLVAERNDPDYPNPVELLVVMENPVEGVLGDAVVLIDPNIETSCCEGLRGNVDGQGDPSVPTLGDLTVLIDHLFISLTPLDCWEEANLDGSQPEGDGSVTLGDLTILVDNLFISLESPIPCP
ncbi:S8 family serine peptidase, partial [candidate division GN15 bacterium]|nr:S8 family serine peptidase [candidate division GN15 bacterium]